MNDKVKTDDNVEKNDEIAAPVERFVMPARHAAYKKEVGKPLNAEIKISSLELIRILKTQFTDPECIFNMLISISDVKRNNKPDYLFCGSNFGYRIGVA